MPDSRVRVDVERVNILKRLVGDIPHEQDRIFASYADAIAFAAAFGAARRCFVPVLKPASEPSPIRQDIFANRGHDMLLSLLALYAESDPMVLSTEVDAVDKRTLAFEAYANGGLGLLESEMKGEPDALEKLLLLMNASREDNSGPDGPLPDLRNLLA